MTPETREFLAMVRRAEDPSSADEGRVLAALEAALAAGAAGGGPDGATTAKSAVSGAASGLKLLGTVLGIAVGAALVASAFSSEPAEPKVPSLRERSSVPGATVRSSASATPSTAAPTGSATLRQPAASAPHVPSGPAPAVARVEARSRGTELSSASLREEIALLAFVQTALEHGNGAEALRRLDAHVTNDRQFVAERRAARIMALCQLGRVSEAERLAVVFFRENPDSVQRTAVERSCAVPKTNGHR
jgi:hypothetical protein